MSRKKVICILMTFTMAVTNFVFCVKANNKADLLDGNYRNGETYEFVNCSAETQRIYVEGYDKADYSYDYVVHPNNTIFSDCVRSSRKNNIGFNQMSSIDVPVEGKLIVTITDRGSIQFLGDKEAFDIFTVSSPALFFSEMQNGESLELQNYYDVEKHLMWNANAWTGYEYIVYNPDGSELRRGHDTTTTGVPIPGKHSVSITLKYRNYSETPFTVYGDLTAFTQQHDRGVKSVIRKSSIVPSTPIAPSTNSAPVDAYLYDVPDPGETIILPTDRLQAITDTTTAISAIQSAALELTSDQKQSLTGTDLITLFAEEAIAQASSQTVSSGDIVVDNGSVSALQSTASATKAAAEQALSSEGITTAREMRAGVKFKTQTTDSIKITIDPSTANTSVDNVCVETPDYAVSLSMDSIKENTSDGPLIIMIEETGTVSALESNRITASVPGIAVTDIIAANPATTKTTKVTFSKPVTQNVKVSLPPTSGDTKYQAVTNSKNEPIGGKYNPATGKIDVKVSQSDTYTVKENRKDFSDISKKSNEMQNAIRVLASKGVINGTSATTFSPDSPITRAEIAGLIMRAISKYNANADGGFSDVKKSDWFFGAAGSAKKNGIMSGTSATMFSPRVNIPKDQIVAVSARVLKSEMKYKSPSNTDSILSVYTDKGSIPSWGTGDIALATRENLVVKRTDGRFNASTTMTRGDAAIILYRMFMKIW